jgi:hypothetical protein
MDPLTIVGDPVTETPGLLSARFPITVVAPVLVTVELPKTATFAAAPSETVCAAVGREVASSPKTMNADAQTAADLRAWYFCAGLILTRKI